MTANGNGWTKWLVGSLWGIFVTAILLLANCVIANENKNTDEHKDIRHEITQNQIKVNEKLTEILIAIAELKQEVKKSN